MIKTLFQKLAVLFLIFLGAVLIVHTLIYLIPGDPAVMIAGEYASREDLQRIRSELSLDQSFWTRYAVYTRNILLLDFGNSIYYGKPVFSILCDRFPATLLIALLSMLIAGAGGIILGISSALFQGTWKDGLILGIYSLFISTPVFVSCFILALVFSYGLGLLPPSGKMGLNPAYMIMPALALASRSLALIIRVTRNEMIDVLNKNYIRTARALGFPERRVVFLFGLKNVIVPVMTIILLDFGAYLGGAVVTETVFSWPGIGRLMIIALQKRDVPLVQGVIIFGTLLFILVGLAIDMLPRLFSRGSRHA